MALSAFASPAMGGDTYLFQKQMEVMIETMRKKNAEDVASLQKAVARLEGDIAGIRQSISLQPRQQGQARQEQQMLSIPPQQVQQVSAKHDAAPNRPRYGDYKPGDVSIEKFFYCGGGRR
ncbi:TPA: hypothetical protein HA361_00585 [Candidatus Woesearchaeota archaeon]|nr:hypothetical protein [Candidatus Woesearchaeota archaeon]HII68736.1 hypothetical protein [Candidatus Woesearchaeota archaeon]